jgi:hypothetical protein
VGKGAGKKTLDPLRSIVQSRPFAEPHQHCLGTRFALDRWGFPQPFFSRLWRPWGRRDRTRRYARLFLLFILWEPGFLKRGGLSSPPSAWFPPVFPLFRYQRLLLLSGNGLFLLFVVVEIFWNFPRSGRPGLAPGIHRQKRS